MEPNKEVLVVIQAESGEEIAVPLAALDEQHQEVILDSDGITTNAVTLNTNGQNIPGENATNGTISNDISDMDVDSLSASPFKETEIIRQKQNRKEKLVYLPLFDDDNKLEFQIIDQSTSPGREEIKRKPRKEYRTKRRLAALSAAAQEQHKNLLEEPQETKNDPIDVKPPASPSPTKQIATSPKGRGETSPTRRSDSSRSGRVATSPLKECDPSPPKRPERTSARRAEATPAKRSERIQPKRLETSPAKRLATSPTEITPRRTRLSNSCRVATDKMYRCNDCDFSTERINNIILHMKETCPKLRRQA